MWFYLTLVIGLSVLTVHVQCVEIPHNMAEGLSKLLSSLVNDDGLAHSHLQVGQ